MRQDLRYALRHARRSPSFVLTAVIALALGIGASTAVFTVVNAVLLRPLPFVESTQLAMMRPTSGSRVSDAYVYEWRRQTRTFRDIAAWYDARVNLTGRGEPIEIVADRATTNFFAVLGTRPPVGRTFTTGSDLGRVEPEVVLSDGLWRRRYGGDPAVIGQPIALNGESFTIVGVMPKGFAIRTTELAESRAELWIATPLVPHAPDGMGGGLNVIGRLAAGASIAQGEGDLLAISHHIEEQFPSYSRDWGVGVLPLFDATVQDVRPVLVVLLGSVGILLLMTCANVANLVLSRGVARSRELRTRLALGATTPRLIRQQLHEALLLACGGGVCGIVLAAWATKVFLSHMPTGIELPRTSEIGVDARMLAFALLSTVVTAVLFGLFPSLRTLTLARSAFREGTLGARQAGDRSRVGPMLTVAQVAIAVTLLIAAGLLARTFWNLSGVAPGFEPNNVLTARTTLPASAYGSDERVVGFGTALVQRIERLPGVEAVGFANYLPMSRFGAANQFEIEGRPRIRDEAKFSWVSIVGGRYFEAMRIPVIRGRLPDERDSSRTSPVFVIDESLARRYWPDTDPVGARIVWQTAPGKSLRGEVIGVVGNVKWGGVAADAPASAYWWFSQVPSRELSIVVRASGDPLSLTRAVAAIVRQIDPNQPLADVRPLGELVADDVARPRFTMVILAGFAIAALLLAGVGLYGVLALSVAQRTREVGVRMALGAQRHEILTLVLRRAGLLVGSGLAIGVAAALASGRAVAGLLYGVTAHDLPTMLVVVLFVGATALVATCLPARRAMRVEPLEALKAE
jgi:putative ABC transport system permease protein